MIKTTMRADVVIANVERYLEQKYVERIVAKQTRTEYEQTQTNRRESMLVLFVLTLAGFAGWLIAMVMGR